MRKILSTGLLMILMLSMSALADDRKNDDHRHDDHHHDRGGSYPYPGYKDFFRLDCRYHNIEGNRGAHFCYASAIYQKEEGRPHDSDDKDDDKDKGKSRLTNIHLGVGCDNQTIFYDKARLHVETTLDRLSPLRAATPGVEVFPQGQLTTPGTYTSELDISLGRFQGLCYVHKVTY